MLLSFRVKKQVQVHTERRLHGWRVADEFPFDSITYSGRVRPRSHQDLEYNIGTAVHNFILFGHSSGARMQGRIASLRILSTTSAPPCAPLPLKFVGGCRTRAADAVTNCRSRERAATSVAAGDGRQRDSHRASDATVSEASQLTRGSHAGTCQREPRPQPPPVLW